MVEEHEHVESAENEAVDVEEIARHQTPRFVRQRNSAQVGPDRRGDGSMPWCFRIVQTLEGAMTRPMVASSSWMRR